MTEFLKNNPIALRHCLLYEFIQEIGLRLPRNRFYEIIGDDVISKKEYQFWFHQFKKGKFHKNEEPIPDIRDILKNDKYALRACILCESLRSEFRATRGYQTVIDNSFFKYNNFCEVVGDDVMEYREFDFWFYRFLNGEYDLNFEREDNKKIYELTDMPIDIMENIVKYLKICDRLALAKTSRSLQNFVLNQNLFHEKIELHFYDNWAHFQFEGLSGSITYTENENGCERKYKQIENVSHWNQAIQDFESFMKFPKLHVDSLEIRYELKNKRFFDLKASLNFSSDLHLKILTLKSDNFEPLLKILPALEPGYLTTIDINISKPEFNLMEEIMKLEQWKQAKYLNMGGRSFVGSISHFFHFTEFDVRLRELSIKDIREMKEILFKSPNFEKCTIRYDNPFDMDAIRHEFGNSIQGRPNIYHHPISNSNEYFEIKTSVQLYSGPGKIEIQRKKR